MKYKLKSGQINYESLENQGAYHCVVIRDGVFYNLKEDQRLDLIHHLMSLAPSQETVDLEDMF